MWRLLLVVIISSILLGSLVAASDVLTYRELQRKLRQKRESSPPERPEK